MRLTYRLVAYVVLVRVELRTCTHTVVQNRKMEAGGATSIKAVLTSYRIGCERNDVHRQTTNQSRATVLLRVALRLPLATDQAREATVVCEILL